jgi:hypothetical protein
MAPIAEAAAQFIVDVQGRWIKAFAGSGVGLVVAQETDAGAIIDPQDIFGDIGERWRELTARNATLSGLSRSYVSGEE